MDTLYWLGEYGKILIAYGLLIFVWPLVVFGKHLKNKDKTYKFCFCVTVQIVIVTTVILLLGLCHILNRWVVVGIFYGIFAYSLIKKVPSQTWHNISDKLKRLFSGTYRFKSFWHDGGTAIKLQTKRLFVKLKEMILPNIVEYSVLCAIIVYAVIYFIYGVFNNYGYGTSDMYVHHQWIDGLLDGNIFYSGIYPEGMHCVIYCLHVLFGIDLYSCVLLLADVQIIIIIIAAYLFLRKIFRWKFSAFFAIMLFLTVNLLSVNEIYVMPRFQWTLPQEFGIYTVFIGALFFIRYLDSSHTVNKGKLGIRQEYSRRAKKQRYIKHEKRKEYIWNENLIIFAAAFAASVSIHFYCTIMLLLLLIPFTLFNIKKFLNLKKLIPLVLSFFYAVLIAITPMAIALAEGYPLQDSLYWATSVINSGEQKIEDESTIKIEKVPDDAPIGDKIEYVAKVLYWKGYVVLYNKNGANLLISITLIAAAMWACYRLVWLIPRIKSKNKKDEGVFKEGENYFNGYLPIITASVLFMLVYVSFELGLPQIIAGSRICGLENLLLMSVAVIPIDMIFALLCEFCKAAVLQIISVAMLAGIYLFAIFTGIYRGFLLTDFTRYSSEVIVTDSIIRNFPPYSYTIVSTTSELYQINRYGYHEELLKFIQEIDGSEYFLPTEYVFIFVEKRPLQYAQIHFYTGPEWLARNVYHEVYKTPTSVGQEILASVITVEDAQKSIKDFENNFNSYKELKKRTILESKAYQWCQKFMELYPYEMNIYYEDDNFICYYLKQNPQSPYNLAIDDWDQINGEEWQIETNILKN